VGGELVVADGLRGHPLDGQPAPTTPIVPVLGIDVATEAEVTDLGVVLVVDEDVPGGDVAVDEASLAEVLQSAMGVD